MPITASEKGIYIFYLISANGNTFSLKFEFEVGDKLTIPIGKLNENMVYKFTIEKPSGEFITQNDCEKFKIQTIINTQIDGCSNNCDDTDTPNGYYN